ncbi:MAG: DUF2807 domain-containing protein [Bacteroides sp.]|nr:DUF2807 domain-containing protein [Roseburia sp.]MCM1347414.1 DUF2807 domain-containing protein [Bacteroides sp.]MCM1420593.1 DUF2807 domain-containing protein [Bacteroides sp.]
MKTRAIAILSMILWTVTSVLAANDETVTEKKSVGNFTEISTTETFAGNIYFTQGDNLSVTVKGKRKNVDKLEVYTKNGKLVLNRIKEKKNDKTDKSMMVDIYVTAKDMKCVSLKGVGNITVKEALDTDKLKVECDGVNNATFKDIRCAALSVCMRGVGNFNGKVQCEDAAIYMEGVCNGTLDVQCRNLKANLTGVGNLTLKGKAQSSSIQKEGIGHINRKGFECGK